MALYEALAIRDIRDAADLLRPVYDATGRADGYVSLEVSPYLAHDTAATIEEARRLWKAVGRDNLMIKVPGTAEGVPAIRQLISEGINVNITLLFGVGRYADVATAYIEGLSTFVEHGGDAAKMGSVASFFVSRIDTMVDAMIAKRLATVTDAGARASLTQPAWEPWRLPTPSSRTSATWNSAARRHGNDWPPRARIPNVSCGRAPAPRILGTATSAMSKN